MSVLSFEHDDTVKFKFDDGYIMRTIKIDTKKHLNIGIIREVGGRGQIVNLSNQFTMKSADDIQMPTNGMLFMNLSMTSTLFFNDKLLVEFRPRKHVLCISEENVIKLI